MSQVFALELSQHFPHSHTRILDHTYRVIALLLLSQSVLSLPGFTAYSTPNDEAIDLENQPVIKWSDNANGLEWIADLKKGDLKVVAKVTFPTSTHPVLTLKIGSKKVKGKEVAGGVEFPTVQVTSGYQKIDLVKTSGAVELTSLDLAGAATVGAKANMKPRRNAPSVHLGWQTQEPKVEWFYNEIRAKTENTHSYYMACGFRRGYFGMQINSPTERRVIFSVWDAGNEGIDRSKVEPENQVTLLGKGNGVEASGFGNEGTGGHSHIVYPWKAADPQRFLLRAEPKGDKTIYTAYFWFKDHWGMIAKFRAPHDGNYLSGLYSFNENFWGTNGNRQFAAEFGSAWIKPAGKDWVQLPNAKLTCDPTGHNDRFDYTAMPGKTKGTILLTNGGAVSGPAKAGAIITASGATGQPPALPKD